MSRFSPSSDVARVRESIDHPIVDADGHHIEFLPLVFELAAQIAGRDVADRIRQTRETHYGSNRVASGAGFPARNTLDRVTVTAPRLLHRRLDEIGIDFALIYPSFGLGFALLPDAELRQVFARALNTYASEVFAGYRDRLEPVATIPTVTPAEAIEELRYAVETLGLKSVVMAGTIVRQPTADSNRTTPWVDAIGHGIYDYDPLWEACRELRVSPTFHGSGRGWGTRTSPTNFVFNHIGHFASAQEAACRSLVMGGAPRRFPTLRFGFLEGGITWAAQLFADLLGHYEKRNKDVVGMFEPSEQDPVEREALWREFADGPLLGFADDPAEGFVDQPSSHVGADDFADAQITDPEQIVDLFARRFYFGCEADDPLNSIAFRKDLLPRRTALHAVFGSDIGHFDVPDIRDVLREAWEPVEDGLMNVDDFRRFACTNVVDMLTAVNPDFFAETTLDKYVTERRSLLGTVAAPRK